MITITVYKNENQEFKGFLSKGHAGYGYEGSDIICAAVSALTVNAINSIEKFTSDKFDIKQADGMVLLAMAGEVSKETNLLLDSMVLGLMDIQKNYGNEYIKLIYEEV